MSLNVLFIRTLFVLISIMGTFYFILVWRGLKSIKLKKVVLFLPTPNKFLIQNNPLMQLRLNFHKTANKNKLKVCKCQSNRLSGFSAIKKTVTRVKGWRGKFYLLLSLFLLVHINFQYELNSQKSIFIVTVMLFCSVVLLIFSHLQIHCFVFNFSL